MDLKLRNLSPEERLKLVPYEMILLGYRGSIAHETYQPQSDPSSIDDRDIMGVFISDLRDYLGVSFKHPKPIEVWVNEWDAVHYDVRHFVSLLCKSNPNVLSLLWMDDNKLITSTELGRLIRQRRDIFTSRAIYHSFTGYAYGQLKRMTAHEKRGFMGEKRKRLVDEFGYDCKNAAHLIRLLRMGIEFLNEGVLYVERKDAPQLIDIKRGAWTLDQVQEEAQRLFRRAEDAYDRCTLPVKPDIDAAEALLEEIILTHYGLG
jgi:uncharacterized protein